jgi:hypothetical protein
VIAARPLNVVRPHETAPCTERSTNQNQPHFTASYGSTHALIYLLLKVGPLTLSLALSNRPILPRGQHDWQPEPTTEPTSTNIGHSHQRLIRAYPFLHVSTTPVQTSEIFILLLPRPIDHPANTRILFDHFG